MNKYSDELLATQFNRTRFKESEAEPESISSAALRRGEARYRIEELEREKQRVEQCGIGGDNASSH